MNFLSQLMPGVRNLRAPLAGGGGWAIYLALWLWPRREIAAGFQVTYGDLVEWLWSASPAAVLGIVAVAIYILGMLAEIVTKAVIKLFVTPPRLIVHAARRHAHRTSGLGDFRTRMFFRSAQWRHRFHPIPRDAIEHAQFLVRRSLPELQLPNEFPTAAVLQDRDAALQKLASQTPEQYQLIDQAQSEAEFKLAVGPSLIAIGVVLVPTFSPMAFVSLLGIGVTALALRDVRRANSRLWTAAFLGYTESPLLIAAQSSFEQAKRRGRLGTDEEISAWLYHFLLEMGVDWRTVQESSSGGWMH